MVEAVTAAGGFGGSHSSGGFSGGGRSSRGSSSSSRNSGFYHSSPHYHVHGPGYGYGRSYNSSSWVSTLVFFIIINNVDTSIRITPIIIKYFILPPLL